MIHQKERAGARLQYRLRIIINILYFIATLLVGTGATETKLVSAFIVLFLAANTFFYILLQKRIASQSLHYAGVLLDAAFVISIAIILHHVMGIEKTPFSFILKTDIYPITILFLLFHMINFQPRIILFSGILFWTMNLGFLLTSLATTKLPTTIDYTTGFTSYRINPGFEMGKLVLFAAILLIVYFISRRVRNTIREAAHAEVSGNQLRRYFSPGISRSIVESSSEFSGIGGTIQNVAVLFSDIKGFTALSEKLTPGEILSFLAEYHQVMVSIIFRNHGTLDKFIGDAIMATFGTPYPSAGDTHNAIRAALEMNEALEGLNARREREGKFPILHRIGIHSGQVLAGNIGTAERLEYTVIGDTVNTANRIEQACKALQTSLLVSEDVYRQTEGDFLFEDAGRLQLKGKSSTIKVYTVARKQKTDVDSL